MNSQLMRVAGPQAVFMHCQPGAMRPGSDRRRDGFPPCSIAYNLSENRLHMQKAILLALLS